MDQVDEIKSKIDIVEVISSYIPLKKTGRNFAGLCPFHSEKTPSFMVSAERQVFKCFGCSEGGDVFTFLEKIEGWDFREALEELAKRAGVKLTAVKVSSGAKLKEKLVTINNLCSKFYKYLLLKHKAGERARAYLAERGIPQTLWEKFDLGYAPAEWESLANFLTKRGYTLSDIATAGLVIGRGAGSGSGYYDRFRDRLMFPIKDSRGTILGFAGRLIEQETRNGEQETRKEAKYINSPETPIFTKGNLLFGLDIARSVIREANEVVLVEGEFDVLSSHIANVGNVVASKGTALTQMQVATLSRLCERVVLCFDTDLAGDAAARRGIELLDLAGMTIKVARLGKFKDPDEMAQKDPQGFRAAIKSGVDIYDYFIDSAASRNNPKTPVGKKKIGQEILSVLSKISDDLVRAHYISKLAAILDLETQLIADAVSKSANKFMADEATVDGSSRSADVAPRIGREEYFLALLVSQNDIPREIFEMVSEKDFTSEQASKFFKFLRDIIKRPKAGNLANILKDLPSDLSGFVDDLYLIEIVGDFTEREKWAAETVKIGKMIKRDSLKRKLSQISQKLSEAQGKSDSKQVSNLLREFAKISQDLGRVVV